MKNFLTTHPDGRRTRRRLACDGDTAGARAGRDRRQQGQHRTAADRHHRLPVRRRAWAPRSPASSRPTCKRSGLFAPIDKGAFIEKITNPDAAPRFEDWKVINAQALVTGRVTQEADGRLRAEFRLWDTFAGQQLIGEQFFANKANSRRVAHIIADAIYERLTGEKGYFDTRVVFVDESGPKNQRKKRLAIMDQDGAGVRYLSDGSVDRADAALLAEPAGNHLHVL